MANGGGENKCRIERMVSSARGAENLNSAATGNQRHPYHQHSRPGTALNGKEDHEKVQAKRYNRTVRR